jgi:4-amino-4-deoxy-L-arabinose transferase-like glycosyltransferase
MSRLAKTPAKRSAQPATSAPHRAPLSPWMLIWGVAVLALAVATYFFGLDSLQIPKNGDEFPYAHITRLTAESGHWLPLQSALDNMRNTKPPMLFWQGILSTGWGQDWTLWQLRYPNVLYTLSTALLVGLLGWKISHRNLLTGILATLIWLAFFSTYRFGRPFLTNAGEVFWLFMPFFLLLMGGRKSFESPWGIPCVIAVCIGIGLLYKSFALLLPVGLGLAFWYWRYRHYRIVEFLRRDLAKLILIALLSLAIFALWFVFDPDPRSVWQEFVIGENAGKFDPHGPSYLAKMFWGDGSIWTLLPGYGLNAGLMAFVVFGVMGLTLWRLYRHQDLNDDEKFLWWWVLILFLVFCFPSQRSSRYLLEAMPALAILIALVWFRLSRWLLFVTTLICTLVITAITYLAWLLQHDTAQPLYTQTQAVLVVIILGLLLLALLIPRLLAWVTLPAVFAAYLTLTAFLSVFDGPMGRYQSETQWQLAGQKVYVPYNFNAAYEQYRFLLPGADIRGYRSDQGLSLEALRQQYPLLIVQQPLDTPLCTDCRILGQRLELKGRQSDDEIRAMLKGEVARHLFLRELLIDNRVPSP